MFIWIRTPTPAYIVPSIRYMLLEFFRKPFEIESWWTSVIVNVLRHMIFMILLDVVNIIWVLLFIYIFLGIIQFLLISVYFLFNIPDYFLFIWTAFKLNPCIFNFETDMAINLSNNSELISYDGSSSGISFNYIQIPIENELIISNVLVGNNDLISSNELVSSNANTSSGTPSGTPGGTPGGMPSGGTESALLTSDFDEDKVRRVKVRPRSISDPLPLSTDKNIPLSTDKNIPSNTDKNIPSTSNFNITIPSFSRILTWLTGNTSLTNSLDLDTSNVSPASSVNVGVPSESISMRSSSSSSSHSSLTSSVRELISSNVNLSGLISPNNSLFTGSSSATSFTLYTNSTGTSMRNFAENAHWNEIIVERINDILQNKYCMFGTPDLDINPRAISCFTNGDLKPYLYEQINIFGFKLPIVASVDYHHTESPFTTYTTLDDIRYSYTSLIGRNYILIPSYFYIDSNGESTFIELGRQYHIFPINEARNVYNCMITYPNNTTVLINNLVALKNDIFLHRCSILMTHDPYEFLFTNPYEDYMNRLILNFIRINTSNFSGSLPPFITNELYRYVFRD